MYAHLVLSGQRTRAEAASECGGVGDERTESQLLPWEVRKRAAALVYSWPLKSTQMGV